MTSPMASPRLHNHADHSQNSVAVSALSIPLYGFLGFGYSSIPETVALYLDT